MRIFGYLSSAVALSVALLNVTQALATSGNKGTSPVPGIVAGIPVGAVDLIYPADQSVTLLTATAEPGCRYGQGSRLYLQGNVSLHLVPVGLTTFAFPGACNAPAIVLSSDDKAMPGYNLGCVTSVMTSLSDFEKMHEKAVGLSSHQVEVEKALRNMTPLPHADNILPPWP